MTIKYMYVRSEPVIQYRKNGRRMVPFIGRGYPIGCISYNIENNVVYFGISDFNPKDKLNLKLGREIANGRRLSGKWKFGMNEPLKGRELDEFILKHVYDAAAGSNLKVGDKLRKGISRFISMNFMEE